MLLSTSTNSDYKQIINGELHSSFIYQLANEQKYIPANLKKCFSKKIDHHYFKLFPNFLTDVHKISVYRQWILYLGW